MNIGLSKNRQVNNEYYWNILSNHRGVVSRIYKKDFEGKKIDFHINDDIWKL